MVPSAYTNRLIHSTSPYLLQHAHNPVDWYPWGEEALGRARTEDKPIFLSIGYASCHWCHVMEHESFEDEETARLMNEHFISIKVDREERPDLDEIYMNAVQLMGRRGGWPLNLFLTPDLRPFYGGSYFPREDMQGMPGFRRVLTSVAETYRTRRSSVESSAEQVAEALRLAAAGEAAPGGGDVPGRELIESALGQWSVNFDPEWGGFGSAPKFPPSMALRVMLEHHARTGSGEALDMAARTLDAMAAGGLYDQVGGGFHRYSTDRRWLVPHFEKMLYDNALLARAYVEGYQATGRPAYERVARQTLEYLQREMATPGGAFSSGQDADTDGEEGRFYTWTPQEVAAVLGPEDAELFNRFYDVTPAGNFEGRSVLSAAVPPEEFAPRLGLSPEELEARLDEMRCKLLGARNRRTLPGRDDKVLTDWNGLAVSAFAYAGAVLDEPLYVTAAERAARFILTEMQGPRGLLHAHRSGRSHTAAMLDDYAFMIEGLLDLYEATFDVAWVREARSLADEMIDRFWDGGAGGFFQTAADRTDLVVRIKRIYDGSVPSSSAVAARGLLRLARLTDERKYLQMGETTLRVFSAAAKQAPTAVATYLLALDFYHGPVREIAIVGRTGADDTAQLLATVRRHLRSASVVAKIDPDASDAESLARAIPFLAGKTLQDGCAAAYVCQDYACRQPVTSTADLEKQLA